MMQEVFKQFLKVGQKTHFGQQELLFGQHILRVPILHSRWNSFCIFRGYKIEHCGCFRCQIIRS